MNSFLRPPRSIRPGTLLAARSQSLSPAKQNIKEDAGNSVADLAKRMAGANVQGDGVKDGFIEITGAMASQVPKSALAFGLAGGVPYVGADATTVYLTREPGLAAAANQLSAQFRQLRRPAVGAAPVLFAWPTLALNQTMALDAQWAGFTALWRADLNATAAGWRAPKWHSQYRFYLSTLVDTCILSSLAGITYRGPIGGHGLLARELDQVREERKALYARNPEAQYGNEMTFYCTDSKKSTVRSATGI
ncbi:hypothetical protein B0H10DRAFT_2247735 [Mycena sp. CBHHK59/15]|nr:hypothetical protein B0H10DRAFT_2247735 [Mycena sp. CBHHK59/15]